MTDRAGRHSIATYFVAGTDTGVGKTRAVTTLLATARTMGLTVVGMKPVAAGAEMHEGRMISSDAVMIASSSGQKTTYGDLNPYCLFEPISPHIAADRAGISIDIDLIVQTADRLKIGRQLLLVEGAGGWYAPISERQSMADIAQALACPVILVVGLKLGCLNHARLTLEAINRSGCRFAGWIGNQLDPAFTALDENLSTLEQLLGRVPLGILPYSAAATHDTSQWRGAISQLLELQNDQLSISH